METDNAFVKTKPDIPLPYAKYSKIENKKNGTNIIFKCSMVLSFTALKKPTIELLPDHSYVKCRSVPRISVKNIPIMCHDLILFCLFILN